MRTKKILSVLLAVMMLMSIGMTAVYATEADNDFGVQAAPGDGWPTTLQIEKVKVSWTTATLEWKAFAAKIDSTTKATLVESYFAQKGSKTGGAANAGIDWYVTMYDKDNKAMAPVKAELSSFAAVGKAPKIYQEENSSNGTERLIIDASNPAYSGKVDVKLVVWARDENKAIQTEEATISFSFYESKEFAQALLDAKAIVDNKDRYKKEYYDAMSSLYDDAVKLSNNLPSNADVVVPAALAALKAEIAKAKDNYKLVGWDFLDNLIAKPYYAIKDFFDQYSGVFDSIKKLFTAIGGAFSFLTPLFQLIFGAII